MTKPMPAVPMDPPFVAVNTASMEQLLADLELRFATGRGFSVATLNLDHAVKLPKDDAFRAAYAAQTHVTADGNPIVWLCRLSGTGPDVELVPGSELVLPIADLAARSGVSVALFGATEPVLKAAAKELQALCPGLEVALCLAPPMGFDPDGPAAAAAIAQIRESGACLVFLALGAPKQERFAARAQMLLPEVGFLSIGAGLDFIAGSQRRAPVWVQKIAAEWVWRMFSNPRRLALRYLACIAIMPRLTAQALRMRWRR